MAAFFFMIKASHHERNSSAPSFRAGGFPANDRSLRKPYLSVNIDANEVVDDESKGSKSQ